MADDFEMRREDQEDEIRDDKNKPVKFDVLKTKPGFNMK